jgi:hypothetical protein
MAACADEDVSASAIQRLTSSRMAPRLDRGLVGTLMGIRVSGPVTTAVTSSTDAKRIVQFQTL